MEQKQNRFNPLKGSISGGVKLPKIDKSPRLKSTFTAYGKTHPVKLPELGFHTSTEELPKIPGTSGSERKSTPPVKLTKQNFLSRESSARENRISDRLSLELEMKISSAHRSFTDFTKKYRSVNENIQDAVRRSAADSIKNRPVTSSTIFSDGDSKKCYDKYFKELEIENAALKEGSADSPRAYPKMFGLDPLTVLESSDDSSGDSDSDGSPARKHNLSKSKSRSSRRNYADGLDGLHPRSLSPIMPNLSEKAFLTNLKRQEGQANKGLQQMQFQLNAVHQKVAIDRRKADLQASRSKPLYNPRNHGPRRVDNKTINKGPRTDITNFVQTSGGRTGSWKPEDHAKFLKAYKQWKDEPEKLIDVLTQQVKSKRAPDIMAHVKWYEQYNALNQASKEQLQNSDLKKRPQREMIYQNASEGQKAKLENDKRRQDHIKTIRVEERNRSRAMLSEWKKSKLTEMPSDFHPPKDVNMQDIQKEMMELAEKIQTLSTGKKKIKPPRKSSNSASASKIAPGKISPDPITESEEAQYNDHIEKCRKRESLSATNNNMTKLPSSDKQSQQITKIQPNSANSALRESTLRKLKENAQKFKSIKATENKNATGDAKLIQENNIDLSSSSEIVKIPHVLPPKPSKLTEDTYSHRVRREAQRCKRMEVQSQRSKAPNRTEDSNLWGTSSALLSLGSKKAIPSWRMSS